MNARLYPFSLPLSTPFDTSDGPITRREGFCLRVETTDHVGYGEATPLPGWTESFRRCEHTIETCIQHLDDGDVPAALEAAAAAPATRHAVDLAVLDIRARRTGGSLGAYLGADPATRAVPVNATITAQNTDETVTAARDAVEAGFECLKLKVGTTDPRTDANRVTALRNAIPSAVDVRVDANEAWTIPDVETFYSAIDDRGIEYIEQPLPAADLAGLAELRDRGFPVAVDESLTTHELDAVLAADAADVVVLKPMAVGGIERTLSRATTAHDAGVDPVISTTLDAAIARVAATHLAAATPSNRAAGLATGTRFDRDIVATTPPIQDGQAFLPEGNGNGIAPTIPDDA